MTVLRLALLISLMAFTVISARKVSRSFFSVQPLCSLCLCG